MERNDQIKPKLEQVDLNVERLKKEKTVLEEIVKKLSLLLESRRDEKFLSDDISQDLITQATMLFELFGPEHLSETIGGIKRATESSIPWDEFKYLAVSLNDPALIEVYAKDLEKVFDDELFIVHVGLKRLLEIIETTLTRHEYLTEIDRAIKILEERTAQAKEINDIFNNDIKDVPESLLSEEKLDKLFKKAVKYKEKRQEDRQKNYELKLNIDGKNFNVKYLGDVKNKGFISTFEEYEIMYKDAETLMEKKNILQMIIKSLDYEINNKHGIPLVELKQKYSSLQGITKVSNIDKLVLNNMQKINMAEYNKRVIQVMISILKIGKDLKPNDKIHKIAILDTIARIGELEKKCVFITDTSKWIESRTILYHTVDTKNSIQKFQTLLTKEDIFENLVKVIMRKFELLTVYQIENYSPTNGFLKENVKQFKFNMSIEFLNDLLQRPQDYNISKEKMIELQLSSLEKYELITNWITSIINVINLSNGEKLQSYDEIFEQDKVLELYACFMFKLIGEAFKFIEELEIKGSNNDQLHDFYHKNYDFFEKVRQLRGEMAHSPELTTPVILNTAIQLIEKEELPILERLKDIYNTIHPSPTATFKH